MKLEHEEEEKKARERKEELEVRCDLTSFDRTSFWLYHRRKRDGRTLNMRRKKRRPENTKKGSRYVVIPIYSDRARSDPIAEGKEAKGSRT